MKNNRILFLMLSVAIAFVNCSSNNYDLTSNPLASSDSDDFFPNLSSKEPLLRFSYELETMSNNDFGDAEVGEGHPFVGTEIPIVTRKKMFYQVSEDLSLSMGIVRMEPKHEVYNEIPEVPEMPDPYFTKIADGMATGYDKHGKQIYAFEMEMEYFDEMGTFDSKEEMKEFMIAHFTNPKLVSKQSIEQIKKSGVELSQKTTDNVLVFTKHYDAEPADAELHMRVMAPPDKYEVAYDEIHFEENTGVMIQEIGYNANGEAIDKTTYFYDVKDDDAHVLAADEYVVKQYSKTYDMEYLTRVISFYENYQFQSF